MAKTTFRQLVRGSLFLLFTTFSFNASSQLSMESIRNRIQKDSLTDEGRRIYFTRHIQSPPPKIDGVLDDVVWMEGKWSGDFKQHAPNEGAQPSQKTEVKILYDDKYVYAAIRAYDNEPEKIDKQLGRRDAFNGDIVGVNFDSYHDQQTGFEFNLTAGGAKMDILVRNNGIDLDWNVVWDGKVAYEDSAWTAEFRIPLSQLRYSNEKEQIWGLHAWRWINRNQEENNWDLVPRDNPGIMRSVGEIHGIKDLPKSRRIELMPYGLGKLKYYEKEEGNPFATGTDADYSVGVDGKIGLSSDFTLDFTVNPDFGQVEADPAQLNLSAFEVFLDEKRPFFLEGKNITEFEVGRDLLFYSRRIGSTPSYSPVLGNNEYAQNIDNVAIIGAAKITGKTKNGLSIGIIEGITRKETTEVERIDGREKVTVEPLTSYFVSRVQKDIKNGNTVIGGMFTSTNRKIEDNYLDFMNRAATTGGIDLLHHWKGKQYYIGLNGVYSHVWGSPQAMIGIQESSAHYFQRPDADYLSLDSSLTQLSGYGGRFRIGKRSGGNWRYNFFVDFRSPGLELNDLGFMRRADQIFQNAEVRYVMNEPKGLFREYSVRLSQSNEFNFGGQYLGSSTRLFAWAKAKNKWSYRFQLFRNGNRLDTRVLRGGPAINIKGNYHISGSFHSDGSKKISYGFRYRTRAYDDQTSARHDFTPNATFKITNSMQLSTNLNYSLSTNSMQYIYDSYDNDYFLAQLDQKTMGLTLRLDYAITPELTIQYYGNPYISIGEYSDYKLITDTKAKDYNQLFYNFSEEETVFNEAENNYNLAYSGNNYTIGNPDFNFQQLRSNFVVRWEYKTGSTLYFVWTHNRSQYENTTNSSMNANIDKLAGVYPENVFLVKLNYWFSI